MRRELHTECQISSYEWLGTEGDPPGEGSYLLTKAGSAYLILTAKNINGERNRLRFRCLRIPKDDIPAGADQHTLEWASRSRRG